MFIREELRLRQRSVECIPQNYRIYLFLHLPYCHAPSLSSTEVSSHYSVQKHSFSGPCLPLHHTHCNYFLMFICTDFLSALTFYALAWNMCTHCLSAPFAYVMPTFVSGLCLEGLMFKRTFLFPKDHAYTFRTHITLHCCCLSCLMSLPLVILFSTVIVIIIFWIAEWMKVKESHSVVSDSLGPHGLLPTRLLCPWNSPVKNTGVGCHALLQEILPNQG